jgi:hypothetical protein
MDSLNIIKTVAPVMLVPLLAALAVAVVFVIIKRTYRQDGWPDF